MIIFFLYSTLSIFSVIKAPEEVDSLHYFVYFVKWPKVFKSLAKFNLHDSRKIYPIVKHLFSHLRWLD